MRVHYAAEVVSKVNQLLVAHIDHARIVWTDRYAIVQLEAKAIHGVVNEDYLRQVDASYYAQVLDVDTLLCPVTVFAIQSMIKQLLLRLHQQ